jgi:hypothetical protein
MSNTALAAIVVPIIVALSLAAWITMVYRADRHPAYVRSRGTEPRREVTGGSFRGRGGRQVMPLPGHPPASDDAERAGSTD